jgi:hypothetical protein
LDNGVAYSRPQPDDVVSPRQFHQRFDISAYEINISALLASFAPPLTSETKLVPGGKEAYNSRYDNLGKDERHIPPSKCNP